MVEKVDGVYLCSDCEVIRTRRSRHCNICDRCVDRFDHHCPWINNCVGIGNHTYFFFYIHVLYLNLIFNIIAIAIRIILYSFSDIFKYNPLIDEGGFPPSLLALIPEDEPRRITYRFLSILLLVENVIFFIPLT